jgi:hypothetical protein
MEEFEEAMVAELVEWQKLVRAKRDALVQGFKPTPDAMGRMFALGAIDSALWRMHRRAAGKGAVDE